jgi:hypothetical protein
MFGTMLKIGVGQVAFLCVFANTMLDIIFDGSINEIF